MSPTRLAPAVLALAAASLAPAAARAESYHTCAGFIDTLPATITTQGTWCLRQDIATALSDGIAIAINTNNVTIDCNGFKIGGLGAGAGTSTYGIYALNRSNITIRGCAIRGFEQGVKLEGTGSGHIIEDNRFDTNRVAAIEVHGDGSTIRRNLVIDTGGSTTQSSAFGIATLAAVDVRDNVIDGLAADPAWPDASMTGLFLVNNDRGVVAGNRIGGLVSTGSGVARGINTMASTAVTLRDNSIVGDGRAGGTGIACASSDGVALDNVVINFPTQVVTCTDIGTTP